MRMRMAFGEGMAPVISGDRLILVFDHEGDSFMVMLDKNTGKEIWRVNRDEKSNWAAPLVVDYKGQKQIVVSARQTKLRSYDFETGKVIWECAGLGTNTIPQPVRQDDLIFAMSGYQKPNLMAIRLGREGDSDRHRCHCLEPDPRQFLHAVSGHSRQQAVCPDGQRHGQLLQRPHRRTLLSPDQAAQRHTASSHLPSAPTASFTWRARMRMFSSCEWARNSRSWQPTQ